MTELGETDRHTAPLDTSWFVRQTACDPVRLRLVCLPYAGGSAAVYRDWHRSLPTSIEVWAVELPGRGRRLREPPVDALPGLVDALADAVTATVHGPFAVFGHSLGALLGLELGRALEQRGNMPRHVIVSGYPPPHLAAHLNRPVHGLPRHALLRELRALGGTPAEVLASEELLDLFLPVVRADLALCERHVPRSRPPLRCPLTAFGGATDPRVPYAALPAWQAWTTGEFRSTVFPGGHFYLNEWRSSMLAAIARILASGDQRTPPLP